MKLGYRPSISCLAIVQCLVLFGSVYCPGAQANQPVPRPFPSHVLPNPDNPTIGVKYPYVCPHEVSLIKLLMNQTESGYVQYTEYATNLPSLRGFTMHYWFNLADASTTSTMFNYGLDPSTQNDNLTVQLYVANNKRQFFVVQMNGKRVSVASVEPPLRTATWHHALHSWNPAKAHFSHFLDGKLIRTHDVPLNLVVPGGGVAVSGQHQSTSLTMGMDQGEGLNGFFTLFQLSSKPLEPFSSATETAVARLASQCTGEMEGDLINWRKTPRKGYGGVMETPSYTKVCGRF